MIKCLKSVEGIVNFNITKSSADLAALFPCIPMWNPAEVDNVTLIGNIIITVQYIQDEWSIFILWRDCKQESESENNVKCDLEICISSKASSIAFA